MTVTDGTADISKETLRAWKEGSVEAFEEVVRTAMKRAYAVAAGILGNAEDAYDLSQEAFMAAHRARATFDLERPFFPWFYRILRNRCLNYLRKKAGRREVSIDLLIEKPGRSESPDRGVMKKERAEALWKAIQDLTPEHREIVILRSFQELSYREIAETLGISEGTVMSRLYYARRSLYGKLKDICDDLYTEGDDAP
ncbi:MAG TPA: sigma-70 family RNA polymerase sigma factor [Candidatus Eisenbacteria bacterium]|uniref:Sigma-70 family RNA polymerase sigma factor n=1 Tax=Eiseniibacteriota bacterium TaxID=2212470 RepID=A0A7V2ATX6_UNCEI|nr:sigma-70 family RNA polymerase sigma factor [Candidatus Eisenbacteria bacterium]